MLRYFYLSQDKLARKTYLSNRFYVRVGHGNSTALNLNSVSWIIMFKIQKDLSTTTSVIIQKPFCLLIVDDDDSITT